MQTPKEILEPAARGLMASFYRMVNRASDTQREAKWKATHYQEKDVPYGYEAELTLRLKYVGKNGKDERRVMDRRGGEMLKRLEDLTSDRSVDG